ncbi:helix-turn-helix domain-containing protein [Paenibacillus mendelii]|uniref:Helix-turn-helix domain-containing protein n=1 Tax=Paenibacillus mendelii TaxID=206163 RepID=A0ABV6J5L2_9BACL|nr:AraC family transcriptional regulator [Paenibacillus mendelii]MCQ6561688.1 AraC family transcriptional regulator [Paenibacillus mendelii]
MDDKRRLWKEFMNATRFQVWSAEYTKVSRSWRDLDFVPDFNRFYLIEEGEGLVRIEDTELHPVERQLVFMPAGVRQSYSAISDHTYSKYWCHFTATVGDLRLFDVMETPYLLTIDDPKDWDHWVSLFQTLIEAMDSNQLSAGFRLNAVMMEMMACFVEQAEDVKFNRSSSIVDKMYTVLRYMEQRLSEHMTIEELAGLVHYHPNYFIQVFKQFTGRTPVQYLNAMRVERAKHWLSATQMTVSDVAEKVGMTLFYFSRLFRDHTGFTPSAYRQMNKP